MLQSIGSSELLTSLKGASAHTPTLRGSSEHMLTWSCSTAPYRTHVRHRQCMLQFLEIMAFVHKVEMNKQNIKWLLRGLTPWAVPN
jgi:hypothetical protein